MQNNTPKDALPETKSGQTQPRTQVGELRDLLKTLENRMARLKEISPEEALEILPLLDQATERIETIEKAGITTSGEASQLESLMRQFRAKGHIFVGKVGGAAVLRQFRQEHQPEESHWWWFIDATIAKERQSKLKRWTAGLLVAGAILAILVIAYQQFLAPSPEFQAGIGFQQTAENKLIMGENEAALADVDQAIKLLADAPELLVMRGVLFEILEKQDLAVESFELARGKYESEDSFFTVRAKYYLMAGLTDAGIKDAETAIALNPDSAVSYMYIAQAYEMLGDIYKAIDYYEIASEAAERTNNATLQVMARMQLATLLQKGTLPTAKPTED